VANSGFIAFATRSWLDLSFSFLQAEHFSL
jgi:hypothetical protein